MKVLTRFIKELFDLRYLFLDGGYTFKKWKMDCTKKMKYKRFNVK